MANAPDLMGLGMPSQQAEQVGYQYSALTGVGTTQAGAAGTKSKAVELSASAGNTAVVISGTPAILAAHLFANKTGSTASALVFVPLGHTLNGSLNASLSIAAGKMAILVQFSPKNWYSVLTA
jgi:hypothetical protein